MDANDPRAGEGGTQDAETMRARIHALERSLADLQEKSARYEQILDALPDLISAQRRDGRVLYANRAFCDFHGKVPAEIIGAAGDELRLASTAEAAAERRGQVLATGIFIDIPSERLSRPNGITLPFNALWCPLRNAEGEVDAIVVRARGLRAEDDEEEAASHAEIHTKALLSIIPDMYFRLDRDGTYIDFSAGRGLDTALPPSLFLGKRLQDVTPDVAPWAMAAMEEALRTGEVQTVEYKMFIQDAYVDYEARILPSGPAEVLVLVRNISRQKETEEKLREADARFRAFEGQSMFGIFILQSGKLRYINSKLAAIFDATPEELVTRGLSAILLDAEDHPVKDTFLAELEAQASGGADDGMQRTFRARRRDGTSLYVDVFGAKVAYGGQPAVIGVVLDVTDVRLAEEERARLQEQVMRIQEAMMVELSTPLIPISDDILVMPLIGSVDDRRAQHVMERLLQGVASSRAKVVILDVTGMSSVTTQTASALVRCAQAMRLLGAKALLTGVRPDVAQTLVSMGVDLAEIVTLSTLKAGIAHAMSSAPRAR